MRWRRSGEAAFACAALALLLFLPVASAAGANPRVATAPALVPTAVCSCNQPALAQDATQLRGHGPPNLSNYDEQIGMTFTQSFTSLEYNVTAVAQTDPSLDTGPAYLLNGLSNTGYWYQVGVSWNWGPGSTPGTGFDMNYEVFDTSGNSIYPRSGGGLSAFSGTVNAGDTITLNLYFGNSGDVMMVAEDMNTGAYAETTFSSEGASYFTGLNGSIANSNGYFTGLMTEWYHGQPYYSNLAETLYSTTFSISSGWLWMDEFDVNTNSLVFSANASAPFSFSSQPSTLQEFSYSGITEYADATEFVTGMLNSTTGGSTGSTTGTSTGTSTEVMLTASYSVEGGGSGYGAPVLTYVSGGTQKTASLTATPTGYPADQGSAWSVSTLLPGSNQTEEWTAAGATSGTAASSSTLTFSYQNQYYVATTTNDANGGAVQPAAGWYYAGSSLQLVASVNSGWKFEGWSGTVGSTQLAGGTNPTLNLLVTSPIEAVAVFYPGLVLTTPASISVSYSTQTSVTGQTTGTVGAGTTEVIYVPPDSPVTLTAVSTSPLYSFSGWTGDLPRSSTITVILDQPASLGAASAIDYLAIVGIAAGLAVLAAVVAAALRSRKDAPQPEGPAPAPATNPSDVPPPASEGQPGLGEQPQSAPP